jgi:plasmid maintenance system antidote protein VapI
MKYSELMDKALHDRTVNKAATEMGIPQPSLDRYVKGQRLPTYAAALILAKEAGVSAAQALCAIAAEEAKRMGIYENVKKVFRKLLSAEKLRVSQAA